MQLQNFVRKLKKTLYTNSHLNKCAYVGWILWQIKEDVRKRIRRYGEDG